MDDLRSKSDGESERGCGKGRGMSTDIRGPGEGPLPRLVADSSSARRNWYSNICGQAERPISTGKLRALQLVHPRPINLVVFEGPSGTPYLGAGFPLRCLQRLSVPYIATLRLPRAG